MKKYLLKRYSQPTLRKVMKEGDDVNVYLLRYADFELFEEFMKKYETLHSYIDNSDNSAEEISGFIDRLKNRINTFYESNLYGFYNRVIDINENDIDKYVRNSNMKVVVDDKEVIDVGVYLMFGYIGIELLEKEYLDLFEEIADGLACNIGLNIFEPNTKHEEIPIRSYFKKED